MPTTHRRSANDTPAPRDRAVILILLIASFVVILNETIMPNRRDDYQLYGFR